MRLQNLGGIKGCARGERGERKRREGGRKRGIACALCTALRVTTEQFFFIYMSDKPSTDKKI